MTDPTHPTDKESPMTPKTRHDELKALLSKISEESVTTSNALADMLDLLRERLPEPEGVKDEPAPADDPPGEPVEPGDLRAGDEVAFTWLSGERMTCTLVEHSHLGGVLHSDVTDASGVHRPNLTSGDLWATGISDVRLIERAPREGESPDEALAKVLHSADGTNMAAFHELTGGKRDAYLNMARAAREHIESEQEDAVAFLRAEVEVQTDRAEKAEAALSRVEQQRDVEHAEHLNTKAALADERDRHDATITERDALRERLDALRGAVVTEPSILRMAASDIEAKGTGFGGLPRSLPETLRGLADALGRDAERGAR